jgi:hypothetical protein
MPYTIHRPSFWARMFSASTCAAFTRSARALAELVGKGMNATVIGALLSTAKSGTARMLATKRAITRYIFTRLIPTIFSIELHFNHFE